MLGLGVMAEAQPYLIIRSESERAARAVRFSRAVSRKEEEWDLLVHPRSDLYIAAYPDPDMAREDWTR
jgi:hypothetical protein